MNLNKKNNLVLVLEVVSFIYMSALLLFSDSDYKKGMMFPCLMFLAGAFSRFYKFKRDISDDDIGSVNKGLNHLIFICIVAPILLTVAVVLF